MISINTRPVANQHSAPGERIIEFSSHLGGGLISFRINADGNGLLVDVYRTDDQVAVLGCKQPAGMSLVPTEVAEAGEMYLDLYREQCGCGGKLRDGVCRDCSAGGPCGQVFRGETCTRVLGDHDPASGDPSGAVIHQSANHRWPGVETDDDDRPYNGPRRAEPRKHIGPHPVDSLLDRAEGYSRDARKFRDMGYAMGAAAYQAIADELRKVSDMLPQYAGGASADDQRRADQSDA